MWENIKSNFGLYIIILTVGVVFSVELMKKNNNIGQHVEATRELKDSAWVAPSLYLDNETKGTERQWIIYGQDLIANTSKYWGPHGKLSASANGMNCQNCHLDAGTKPWGNNYSAVFSTYPKFRDRSGTVESIYKRVNDCMERSLNSTITLDSNDLEYKAIYAYIRWLGKEVKKNTKPLGSGIEKLPYLDRAADPLKGKAVYLSKCQSCHGNDGKGVKQSDSVGFVYPPLWGAHSYSDAAGLFRLGNFAGYVKNNMPFGQASHNNAQLTTEEAWDVAAFVNSQPRPLKDQHKDWPDISKKPVDFPYGPYTDNFDELQHKYGPYKPIVAKKGILKN